MTSDSFSEQNYALIAEGVQRFPKPREPKAVKWPVVFVLDFPSAPEDETAIQNAQLPETSQLTLVRRLADKLGILPETKVIFAIRGSVPGKALANDALTSSQADFKNDIVASDPDKLVCFGNRAFTAINRLTGYAIPPVEQECNDVGQVRLEGRLRHVVVVPDVRELQSFPEWRAAVWQVLRAALTSSN